MVNNEELESAIEARDEKKIFFLFKDLTERIFIRHPDFLDWKMIAIAHAFNQLDKWDKSKGKAFSFFYKIIYIRIIYEYRAIKRGKHKSKFTTQPLQEDEVYTDEKDENETYVSIGGRLFDKDFVKSAYAQTKDVPEYRRKKLFKELIGE